ncbi:hypothetical protein [Pedobacter terrae]|uniref:hypothetical protein n=1 Tax=Pedobacter terrae TaxID=405671 RepID=UPI002FFD2288
MARQNEGSAEASVLPYHPSGLIPFPFGFPRSPLELSAFFFPVFLLENIRRSKAKPIKRADHRKPGTRKANVTKFKNFKTGRL